MTLFQANLLQTWYNMSDASFEECQQPEAFKKVLFGLTFFVIGMSEVAQGPLDDTGRRGQ